MIKLVAVVGPTASGKSAFAMEMAKRYRGEIIAADSRTIYRGMDIGTAKPSKKDQAEIQHHFIDILNPDEPYSAAEFKLRAKQVIEEIRSRGNVPIVVGGTGLYVWSLLYDYQFPAGPRTADRAELEAMPIRDLVERLKLQDPATAAVIDLKNPRRVIRALETVGQPRAKADLRPDALIIGLRPSPMELEERIRRRTAEMFDAGLIKEVKSLSDQFPNAEPLRTVGYLEVIGLLNGKYPAVEAQALVELHTRQLARRQLTWFKRSNDIFWFEQPELAAQKVASFLSSKKL